MKILLSTTSYQDTPGPHHELLATFGAEIHQERGPLSEEQMLALAGQFDALLCGDDALTRPVIESSLPRLKVIAKYGIGVDKIDVACATEHGIPVSYTPGVNHTTVAEHVFALLLGLQKNLVQQAHATASGQWARQTGREIFGKTMGIIGLGRVGQEVALRARAFGLTCLGYGNHWPEAFCRTHQVERRRELRQLLRESDIISLHTHLTPATHHLLNAETLREVRPGAVLLNCGRGELVETGSLLAALESGQLAGYGADVLDQEPPSPDHPLLGAKNCLLTPHVGSRTHESVQRQAAMATENLLRLLQGKKPLAQVNDVPPPPPFLPV
ncbi:MAG: phosphoglycerate dehydrogenase [Verrucomicrobiota bacterium]